MAASVNPDFVSHETIYRWIWWASSKTSLVKITTKASKPIAKSIIMMG
jgi:hypothetical protein